MNSVISVAGARLHFNYTGKEQKIRSRHDTPRLSNTPTSSDSNRIEYGQYDPKDRSRTGSSIEERPVVPTVPSVPLQKSPSPNRRVTQPVYFEDLPQTASLYGPTVRKSPSPSRRQTQQVNPQDLERARAEPYSTSYGRNWLHPNQNQHTQNPAVNQNQNQEMPSYRQSSSTQNQNPSLSNTAAPTSSRPSLYTGHSRYDPPEASKKAALGVIGRQRSLGPLEALGTTPESYTSRYPLQGPIGAGRTSTIGTSELHWPQEPIRPQGSVQQAPDLSPRHSSLVSNAPEPPRHSTSVSTRQPFDPSYVPVPPRTYSSSYSTYDIPPVPSRVIDPFGQIPKQNLNPPRPPAHQRSPRSMTVDVASSSQQKADIEEAKRRILENEKKIKKAEEERKAAVRAREEAERKEKLRREEEEKRREEAARKAAETARKVAEEAERKAAEEAARLAAMEDEDEEVTKFIHRLHEQIRDSRESKNAMGALAGRRFNNNVSL